MSDLERRFPDDYTIAELHAIATRALANGDDYARGLLREQLKREEFGAAICPYRFFPSPLRLGKTGLT